MALYELALLGKPSERQVELFCDHLRGALAPFSLTLGAEVTLSIGTPSFDPSQRSAAAALFIGADDASADGLETLLQRGIPVIPVATTANNFAAEIPAPLRPINGLNFGTDSSLRMINALLECAGLLPRQRRVFVSYKRAESRDAALQLFDAFSARMYDVFLDTHGIPPAEDFQALLWHRLCDCEVLVMLDTPGYFKSRWTSAEFGRALAKSIGILRVGWPESTAAPQILASGSIQLGSNDLGTGGGIVDEAIDRVCYQLEAMRSQSIAMRHLTLVSGLQQGLRRIGGAVLGVGLHNGVQIRLADGRELVAYPTVGNPTSVSLHDATTRSSIGAPAIIYDDVGMHPEHLEHLAWLAGNIRQVRLVKASRIAWDFADWVS